MWRRSEGIPSRVRRKLEITDVGAKPQADTGADRHDDDVTGTQCRHAEAADEIGGAVDAAEALIDSARRRQVIDEHHCTGTFAAIVKADRWAFPEHAPVARVLGVKLAIAVAQTDHESAAALLAENVTVGLAPAADGSFHDLRQPE